MDFIIYFKQIASNLFFVRFSVVTIYEKLLLQKKK